MSMTRRTAKSTARYMAFVRRPPGGWESASGSGGWSYGGNSLTLGPSAAAENGGRFPTQSHSGRGRSGPGSKFGQGERANERNREQGKGR